MGHDITVKDNSEAQEELILTEKTLPPFNILLLKRSICPVMRSSRSGIKNEYSKSFRPVREKPHTPVVFFRIRCLADVWMLCIGIERDNEGLMSSSRAVQGLPVVPAMLVVRDDERNVGNRIPDSLHRRRW